jgi:LDH2 family malate/lactate/ureidoglycolate dehydrogenase
MATLLSGGNHTAAIDRLEQGSCAACCQVFMAFDPLKISNADFVKNAILDTIQQVKSALPAESVTEILYPGEQSLQNRKENRDLGIPVDTSVWKRVCELAD